MKRIFLLLTGIFFLAQTSFLNAQGVAINETGDAANAGAILDVSSGSKGILIPRVESLSSITSPADGMLVYSTSMDCFFYYSSSDTEWHSFVVSGISGTYQIGNTSNYMQVGTDGTVTLGGTATAWNDFVVNPMTTKNTGGSSPSWALLISTNIWAYQFRDGFTDELTFTVQLPHDYKQGSTIYPHIHWCPVTAAGTSRVNWVLEYQWINLGESLSSTGSTQTGYLVVGDEGYPAISLGSKQHAITKFGSGISGLTKTISSIIMCRIYRNGSDGSDNYTDNAALLSVDFHYEIDAFGSSTEYTK
jgi:hypothetical protein